MTTKKSYALSEIKPDGRYKVQLNAPCTVGRMALSPKNRVEVSGRVLRKLHDAGKVSDATAI